MPELLYSRCQGDLNKIRNSIKRDLPNENISDYFPDDIRFREQSGNEKPDFKEEILGAYPESERRGRTRKLAMVELFSKRFQVASENGCMSVCHLVVSDSTFGDLMDHVFDFLKTDAGVYPTGFGNLTNVQR